MTDFNPGAIVPSARALLRVLSTRKKSLALACIIDPHAPEQDARRLDALNVPIFASSEPGPAMQLASRATKSVPLLCLSPVADPNACLAARYHGADGVCMDVLTGAWDELAQTAASTHMLPLALVTSAQGAAAAVDAGARALLIRAPAVGELLRIASAVPHNLAVLGEIDSPDTQSLRSLAGHIDAAIVPHAVHAAEDFADLIAEVDP
jgi:indole-3-glycerol phosphate synthase